MLVDHEKNSLGVGYIVEFIHDATENYYEGGTLNESTNVGVKTGGSRVGGPELCV